ncbi:MAG: response regulator [Acidobacteria bacterium]|nr:response regulator [Acidobacteriota bacterium]
MRRVLIVEDNPTLAQAIEQAGEQFQLCADCATDGWDAIEKLETEEYTAIVIDTDLPRRSGFGVLTYLREEVGDALDHVIVMTSADTNEVRRKVSGDRVKVIAKGGGTEDLARAISAVCSALD